MTNTLCARRANGVDDEIVLMGKNGAQVEFEPAIADVANDRWGGISQCLCEMLNGEILRQKIECDRRHD